ncbi:MAG: hypothetical protein IH840_06095 [Candidatus Heimdallarchaeota archaeon]|nr:hypothetical protein [Candidatus Heimdallarchaeota archaeon]
MLEGEESFWGDDLNTQVRNTRIVGFVVGLVLFPLLVAIFGRYEDIRVFLILFVIGFSLYRSYKKILQREKYLGFYPIILLQFGVMGFFLSFVILS